MMHGLRVLARDRFAPTLGPPQRGGLSLGTPARTRQPSLTMRASLRDVSLTDPLATRSHASFVYEH